MRRPGDLVLIRRAVQARRFAAAPYSGFEVGAAIRSRSGRVFTGANIESASYGLTCCAERVALFKALTEGIKSFDAIAVVARKTGGVMPCGACRQLLVEYAPHATVLVADVSRPSVIRKFPLMDLLPGAFLDFKNDPSPEL